MSCDVFKGDLSEEVLVLAVCGSSQLSIYSAAFHRLILPTGYSDNKLHLHSIVQTPDATDSLVLFYSTNKKHNTSHTVVFFCETAFCQFLPEPVTDNFSWMHCLHAYFFSILVYPETSKSSFHHFLCSPVMPGIMVFVPSFSLIYRLMTVWCGQHLAWLPFLSQFLTKQNTLFYTWVNGTSGKI